MKAIKRLIASLLIVPFLTAMTPFALAAEVAPWMPQAGTMVQLSAKYEPALMVGIQLDAKDPFRFNFLIERGQKELSPDAKSEEYRKLVKYFLASLTIPNDDMWVNLSPYEHDRIIPDNFGLTEMGRDLLAQDYLLKQITSSLIHPDEGAAKDFWKKVYEKAFEKYGTTDIPLDTFNKVWIVPDTATIFHRYDTALIVENHLKVMMEQDYLALEKNEGRNQPDHVQEQPRSETAQLAAEVVRDIVIPMLEKEVNEGEHFAPLRQVYSAMLMATWFKKSLKESVLGQVYADRSKVAGVELNDLTEKEQIYQKYLQAYKVGVFNLIREDLDPLTQEVIPRKYFSGGTKAHNPRNVKEVASVGELTPVQRNNAARTEEHGIDKAMVELNASSISPDASQTPLDDPKSIFHAVPPLQFWRIRNILDTGLLSHDVQSYAGKQTTRNNSGGYNGSDKISFSASPNLVKQGGAGSFSTYTKRGVSFIVQTNRPVMDGSKESGFVDEVFVRGEVPSSEIVGISIPEEMKNKPIRSLLLWTELSSGSVESFVLEAVKEIELETGTVVDAKVGELLSDWKRYKEEGKPFYAPEVEGALAEINRLLVDALATGLEQKYGIRTFQEYLDHYIGDKKPMYDLKKDHVWAYSQSVVAASTRMSGLDEWGSAGLLTKGTMGLDGFSNLVARSVGASFQPMARPARAAAPVYAVKEVSSDQQNPWFERTDQTGRSHRISRSVEGRLQGEIFESGRSVGPMSSFEITPVIEWAKAEADRTGDANLKSIVEQLSTKGGIDLDAGLLNMKIKRDGEGMPLPLPMQDPVLMHIEGLSPTILEIVPANALPIFSELQTGQVSQTS